MPATIREKPVKSAFFSRTLARRPAAEQILSKLDISSDSFVLIADKSQIPLAISKFINKTRFAAYKSLLPANISIPGQSFGWRAMESPKRPEKRNSW
jgi:hypothetical protein